jgi:hypothetical protein
MTDDDLESIITGFFVARREHGTSLSSVDTNYLLTLSRQKVPAHIIVQGIEDAFRAKREPPTCLAECKRWITAAIKAHKSTPAPPSTLPAPAAAPPTAPVLSFEQRIIERIRHRGAHTSDGMVERPVIVAACNALIHDIEDAMSEHGGALPAYMLPMLDDALLAHIEQFQPGTFAALDGDIDSIQRGAWTHQQRQLALAHCGLTSILDS